ncbi:MAG: cbb3-type cytochrome c oxidase subunit I, partial [Wenzhouxiangella sp.]
GGITGVIMGTEQLNLIIHNTMYVPGHFHPTVAVGTTLAFMAISYFIVPALFQRELVLPKLAKWQPYLFGIGTSLMGLFQMGAGTLGVSRRHWDMAFTGSAFNFEYGGTAHMMMGLAGISGVISSIGAAAFIIIMVGTILFGKRVTERSEWTAKRPAQLPRAEPAPSHGNIGVAGFVAPGTFILALVILATFVVYFFLNFGY